jgi:hypothetical protein
VETYGVWSIVTSFNGALRFKILHLRNLDYSLIVNTDHLLDNTCISECIFSVKRIFLLLSLCLPSLFHNRKSIVTALKELAQQKRSVAEGYEKK